MRKWIILIILISLLPLTGVSAQDQNLLELAQSNPEFSILLEAVGGVDGLADMLADPEAEYTVFAPTDDAFSAIPAEVLGGIMQSPPSLAAILNYHIVEGKVTAADLAEMEVVTTLLGAPLSVSVADDGTITLNGTATITTADLEASNGVIHVIDGVLLPERPGGGEESAPEAEAGNTLADVVAGREDLAFLNTALTLAPSLTKYLGATEDQLIVFAPNDEAFAAFDEELRNAAIADPALLGSILLYHVSMLEDVEDLAAVFEAGDADTLETSVSALPGAALTFTLSAEDETLLINDEVSVLEVILADNGIVAIIDAVLVPDESVVLSSEDYAALTAELEASLGEDMEAEEESSMDIPEGPALDPNWGAVAGGFKMSELDTADDFFVDVIDPFAEGEDAELYGIEIINWTADYQYTGFIVQQFLPADVLIWMAEQDPTVWENISDSVLTALPAEELAKLPEEVQARVQ